MFDSKYINYAHGNLNEWLRLITSLIEEYGDEAILVADGRLLLRWDMDKTAKWQEMDCGEDK